jgi:hypothetical protein
LKKIPWLAIILIIFGISLRLLPHPPNFTPIGAIAIFSGAYFANKKYYFLIPLATMLFSDIFIGFAEIWITLAVYGSFAIAGLIGLWLKKNKNLTNTIGASLLASSTFFIITNFVVWLSTSWYTKDVSGIIQCYFLAIPFFKNTLFGDLFYVGLFFGIYEGIKYYAKKKKLNYQKV